MYPDSFKTINSRVLMLSQRNCISHVSRCWMYEFEDIIRVVDTVDMLAPAYSLFDKLANRIQKATDIARFIYPGINKSFISKNYELFIACFHSPSEIFSLNLIKGWRKKCSKAVCFLSEIWVKDIEVWRHHLELLKDFDYIFINMSSSISAVANIVQCPCYFIPYGVDAIQFCPYPLLPSRSIDLYSIGNRSLVTHNALLDLAEQRDFFYIYETINGLSVKNYQEHRRLFSNLIKRSRYFITNTPKFNYVNSTGGQEEISPRFFEGAAGGAVLLGNPPACEDYQQNFDWSDAVLPLPYDALNVADIIANFDSQPERLARVRRNNVVNSLLRHDWVYRWRQVLETVGLEPTPQVASRQVNLQNLAKLTSTHDSKDPSELNAQVMNSYVSLPDAGVNV